MKFDTMKHCWVSESILPKDPTKKLIIQCAIGLGVLIIVGFGLVLWQNATATNTVVEVIGFKKFW